MCADKMLAEGQESEAVKIYRKMIAPANNTWIRIAAYKGLVRAEKDKAVPLILALLKDQDLDLQRAAGKFITEMPGTAITWINRFPASPRRRFKNGCDTA